MNLILFPEALEHLVLPREDPRARHLREVLRRDPGGEFDAGVENGPRGKGRVEAWTAASVELSFTWGPVPPPPPALTLALAYPRPQSARRLLHEATSVGATALHWFGADKGEVGYAQSSLWSSGEWREHLRAGAEQAFHTHLPTVRHFRTLADWLAEGTAGQTVLALDIYESPEHLGRADLPPPPWALALGPERGWSAAERQQLRDAGARLRHLGPRVLRSDTAALVALGLLSARLAP